MHLWRPWIVVGVLAAFAGQAAVVYKWTDAAGVVHYSDQPEPGAEKIFTATNSSASTSTAPSAAGGAPTTPKKAAGLDRFEITSPTPEESFFGDEVINVSLVVEPALKPSQTITWHLNGKQLDDQAPDATHFTLQSLSRGTYSVAATMTDQESGESRSTDSITFYVRQPSLLSPQHQRP